LVGCSELTSSLPQAAAEIPSPPPARSNKPEATTKTPTAKPIEATDEYRNRHPSMWKRKLKASYT
jgi:hypothetical protein